MYDYYLGGENNYEVDRDAAARVARAMPDISDVARENRAFLRRAVRCMAERGIRQFIDIGSGLPTVGNTHEIAQKIVPDARVVYADLDPAVLVHGDALLAADSRTAVITADMRRPDEVLGHPRTTELIDFDEPVGVLLIAMVHFLTDEEAPYVVGSLRDTMAPGSHLALTHITGDGKPPEAAEGVEAVYATTSTPVHFRGRAEVAGFLDGFELIDPGLVLLDAWRPDPSDPGPVTRWLYGAVGSRR